MIDVAPSAADGSVFSVPVVKYRHSYVKLTMQLNETTTTGVFRLLYV